MKQRTIRKTAQTSRRLRRRMTGPEKSLWTVLRNRGLGNLKFRRQHPLDRYIVDFYCHESRLVIELDGDSHDTRNVDYDQQRQRHLESLGLQVLRFTNDDVLAEIDAIAAAILGAAMLRLGEHLE